MYDPRFGKSLTRAALLQEKAFAGSLLADIDAFAGDTNVVATAFTSEESCHNCHSFARKYVLVYEATGVVVVVDTTDGYDS